MQNVFYITDAGDDLILPTFCLFVFLRIFRTFKASFKYDFFTSAIKCVVISCGRKQLQC